MTFKVKKQARDKLAATVHIDDTARVQDVRREDCPEYYDLIDEFRKLSGVAALLDTSFNDKEKPIALLQEMLFRHFLQQVSMF
jgi:carbamoyltransferase